MLRPNEINEKTFEQVGDGVYSAKEVDAFLKEVSASYEQVFKQNGELVRRLSLLANRLEAFRRQEEQAKKSSGRDENEEFNKQLKDKLDQAKAVAQKMLDDAKQKAVGIVNNANKESERILIDLNDKIKEQKVVLDLLNSQTDAFKKQLLESYRQHLLTIDAIPLQAEKIVKSNAQDAQPETPESEEKPNYVVDDDDSDVFAGTDAFVASLDEPVKADADAEAETVSAAPVENEIEDVFSGSSGDESAVEITDDNPVGYNADESFEIDFNDISFDDDDDDDIEIEDDEVSEPEPESIPEPEPEPEPVEEVKDEIADVFSTEENVTSEDSSDGFDLSKDIVFDDDDDDDDSDADLSEEGHVSFKDIVKSKGVIESDSEETENDVSLNSSDEETVDEAEFSNHFKQDI